MTKNMGTFSLTPFTVVYLAQALTSDLSLGRRPTSKTDEFFKGTILVIELQWCENV